jgi:predicted Zn-dependent peptidase
LRRPIAILALLAFGAAAAPAHAADAGLAGGTLAGGTAYMVQSVNGPPVAAIALWYRAPAAGFDEKPKPSLSRLASEVVVASKPLAGKPLGSRIADLGGRINVTVYADSLVVSALVPASSARETVAAMTRSFFAPVVTDDGFKSAQRAVAVDTLFSQYDPQVAVHDAVFSSLFVSGPHRLAPLGSPKDLRALTIDDVRAYAQRAFRAQNAVLVVSGAVDATVVTAAADGRPPTPDAPASPEPFPVNKVDDAPKPATASFSDPLDAFGWVGPPIADERQATALDFIADYLFRPRTGVVSRQLDASRPDTYATGQFVTLHDPGIFLVSIGGKHIDEGSALAQKALTAMQTPLDRAAFETAINAFVYHIASDLQSAQEIADNHGWYAVQGNAAYAPMPSGAGGAYIKSVQALTPEFVAHVASTYLKSGGAVVTLRPDKESP